MPAVEAASGVRYEPAAETKFSIGEHGISALRRGGWAGLVWLGLARGRARYCTNPMSTFTNTFTFSACSRSALRRGCCPAYVVDLLDGCLFWTVDRLRLDPDSHPSPFWVVGFLFLFFFSLISLTGPWWVGVHIGLRWMTSSRVAATLGSPPPPIPATSAKHP